MSVRHLSLPLFYMVAWVGERCPCPVSVYSWGGWESWPWGQKSRRAVPSLTSWGTRESKPCIFPGPHNGANTVGEELEPTTPRLWVRKSCPLFACQCGRVGRGEIPPLYLLPFNICDRRGSWPSLFSCSTQECRPPPHRLTLLAEACVTKL